MTDNTYRIERHDITTIRTGEWVPGNVTAPSYWTVGPGVERLATVEEQDIMRGTIERALAAVRPFAEYVNVTEAGGTPEEAIRKEFGL